MIDTAVQLELVREKVINVIMNGAGQIVNVQADAILAIPELVVLDPDQDMPLTALTDKQEQKTARWVLEAMKKRGWRRVLPKE